MDDIIQEQAKGPFDDYEAPVPLAANSPVPPNRICPNCHERKVGLIACCLKEVDRVQASWAAGYKGYPFGANEPVIVRVRVPVQYGNISLDPRKCQRIGAYEDGKVIFRIAKGEVGAGRYFAIGKARKDQRGARPKFDEPLLGANGYSEPILWSDAGAWSKKYIVQA